MNWLSELYIKLGKALQKGLITTSEWRQVNRFIDTQQSSLSNAHFKNHPDYDYLENERLANATIAKVIYEEL